MSNLPAFSPEQLRAVRLARGLKPEHLAVAIGRSSFAVRDYERGRSTPPTAIVCQLARVLGCPVQALFTEAGDAGADLRPQVGNEPPRRGAATSRRVTAAA